MILIASEDLAVSFGIAAAARRAGVECTAALNRDALLDRCRASAPELVLLDLSTRWADPQALVPELRAAAGEDVRIVAFGPHVHEELLSRASAAGCNEVLSRGRLHATLEDRLAALRREA